MSAYVLYKIDFQTIFGQCKSFFVLFFLDSSWLITFTNSLCVKQTDSYPIHSITQFDQSCHVRVKKERKKENVFNTQNKELYICPLGATQLTRTRVEFVCACFGHLVVKHQIGLLCAVCRLCTEEVYLFLKIWPAEIMLTVNLLYANSLYWKKD